MLMREDQPIASSVHIHTRTYNTAYTTKKATQFGDKQAFIHIVIVSSTSELQKKNTCIYALGVIWYAYSFN